MRFLKGSALVVVTLFFAVALLGILSLRGLPVRGAGSTISGDVNCDGKVDISDAVFTLQFLFTGGPAPCALAQEQEVLDKLNSVGDQIKALQDSVGALAPTWPPKPLCRPAVRPREPIRRLRHTCLGRDKCRRSPRS